MALPKCPEHGTKMSRRLENGWLRCPQKGCKWTKRN